MQYSICSSFLYSAATQQRCLRPAGKYNVNRPIITLFVRIAASDWVANRSILTWYVSGRVWWQFGFGLMGFGARCLSNREFKIRRLRTTATDKYATAHDQNHVTVHFSRVVLRLRWVVELFRVVGTTENIFRVFFRLSNSRISSFRKKFSIHLL